MKKQYIIPATELLRTETKYYLADVSSPKGIDYGGIDNEGTKVPSSRRRAKWSDEDDDEEE